jgi:phosphohistidine phosphatase
MKQLYLLRHAHAEPHTLRFSDFDRSLDERGQEAGKAIATHLSQKAITFDFVMCSAALRAQETLEPLRPILGTSDIEISENFYNIPEEKILDHLRQVSDEKHKILYIGHNPGIAFSILKFAKVTPHFLLEGVTPGTLVGLQFSLDKWMDLEWGSTEITDVFQPNPVGTGALAPSEP